MNTELSWIQAGLNELAPQQLHDLFRLRVDTFVVEQACAYAELDGRDPECIHILGYTPQRELVACCRIVPPGTDGMPHIGRVVVRADHRGRKLAHTLMQQAMMAVRDLYGDRPCALAAQAQLERFYERYGFRRAGPDYDWDGIPHVDMVEVSGTALR
jgi:ElaA protein